MAYKIQIISLCVIICSVSTTVHLSVCLWAAALFLTTAEAATVKTRGCLLNTKYQTLVALLDLRAGESCRDVNLHGVQQLAVVLATVNQINAEFYNDDVTIKLQVFDTCSTIEGTRLATLKSLVASQQTCLETPFLLGFVGPERFVSTIRPITKVFKAAHVVPYLDSQPSGNADAVFTVSSYPVQHHTQAVKSLLKEMGLRKVAVIYEQHEISKKKFDDIVNELRNDFCFTTSIAIQDSTPFSVSEHIDFDTSDSILVIVENPWVLDSVGQAILQESDDLPATVIFSIARVGSIIWPRKPHQNVVILQMTSALKVDDLATNMDSSLLHEWVHQKVTDCAGGNASLNTRCTSVYTMDVASAQQDWSLLPLHYGILLYASAVRITKAACPSGGPPCAAALNSKWLDTLAQASLFVKPGNGSALSRRISFGMDMSTRFLISSVQKNGDYVQVGEVEGGHIHLRTDFKFPAPAAVNENSTGCGPPRETVLVEKPGRTQVFISSAEDSIVEFLEKMGDAQGYQLVGMLAGCGACVIVILLVAFYSVYRSVIPKSSVRSSKSSKNSTISDDDNN